MTIRREKVVRAGSRSGTCARLLRVTAARAVTLPRALALLACATVTLAGASAGRAAIFWINTDGESIGAGDLGANHATNVNQRLIATSSLDSGIVAGPGGYLYWSDTSRNRISRARLSYDKHDRLHVRVTRNFITGANQPEGVALYGGYVYWVNHDDFGSIGRALLNGSDVNQNFVPSESAANGNDLNYPTGIAVTPSFIYWADSNQNSLARAATVDGSGAMQFITGLNDPRGVAVSGNYIYWANDVDSGTIGRANLDGTQVDNSFITGAAGPCMLSVAGSYIYWSNSGYGTTASTLGRAKLDGSGVSERYVTAASSPCGVAISGFVLRAPKHKHR